MGKKNDTNYRKEISQCPSYSNCSAPVCPLDPRKEGQVWFPEEEICVKNLPPGWVKTQKKIQKRTKNFEAYYTFKMITRNCVIGKGISGITPEGYGRDSIETKEKSWLKKHKAKRILTEKEKKVFREQFLKNTGARIAKF